MNVFIFYFCTQKNSVNDHNNGRIHIESISVYVLSTT